MRKTYCIITALVVFILQSVVLPRVFNGIVQPNLILLFVIIVSLRFGQRKGTGVALLGGFLQDVVIGNFFGIHILPYLLVAALSSYLGRSSFCPCRDNSFLSFPTWHNIVFLCLYRTGF